MLYHDEFVTIAFAIFLLIFSITAGITLLALIGKVKVKPEFLKKLFRLLILEVVGVVIAFVSNQLLNPCVDTVQDTIISEEVLLDNLGNWDWCYPESAWRTNMTFKKHNDSLTLQGNTFCCLDSNNKEVKVCVIDWKSTKPFKLLDTGKIAVFPVKMKWKWEVLKFDPDFHHEDIETWFDGTIKLKRKVALHGDFFPDGGGRPWGVVLTHVP